VLDVLNNQENLFVAVADWCRHKKKNLHTNKTLFEPTFRIKKPTTTTKNE
jgi:hypothetical protein